MKEAKVINYGKIIFGVHRGKTWDSLGKDYLEYLISDDCNTDIKNKEIAKKVLSQKNIIRGQLEFDV